MVSRRSLLGFLTTAASASLVTWFAVGEDPPVSVDVDVSDDVDVPAPNVSDSGSGSGKNTTPGSDDDGDADGGIFDTPEWEPKKAARKAHRHVNESRNAEGRDELQWREDVATAATEYATALADARILTHSLDGTDPEARYYADGISAYAGENIHQTWWLESFETTQEIDYIASAADLAKSVTTSWMNSPGHRENILYVTHGAEGIGFAKNDVDEIYAVQLFTR
jgi:uncharacterized protein YkwD